jgi:hypothetical protein
LKTTLGDHFIRFFDEVEGPGDTSEVRAYITAIKDCAPNVRKIKEKSSYFKESHFTVFLVDPVLRDLPLYDKYVPFRLAVTTFTFREGVFLRIRP